MTNPTDLRVEAAALVLWSDGVWDTYTDRQKNSRKRIVANALKAADAAAWLSIETAPRNAKVQLAWLDKDNKWRFDFGMASWDWKLGDYRSGVSLHHAATHWQPLPKSP